MSRLRIEEPVGMDAEQPPDRLRNPILRPDPQQAGTGFEQVQVRIHAKIGIGILLAQAHIFQRPPILRQGLGISVPCSIPDVLFERSEQCGGFVQRRRVTRCPRIFAQAVNRESDRVTLFFAANRPAVGCDLPIDPAVERVDQPGNKQVPDLTGRIQVLGAPGRPVSRRKGPQHPRDQDSALSGLGMYVSATVDTPREMLPVTQECHPEGQDVAGQLLRQLVPPL